LLQFRNAIPLELSAAFLISAAGAKGCQSAEAACRLSQSEKNASARDDTFEAEADDTCTHPHALHTTILRVVIACAKMLLKKAHRICKGSSAFSPTAFAEG